MFGKKPATTPVTTVPAERVTSVLGPGINWRGNLHGSGGVRIEGTFEGEIAVRGLVIIGETGRVNCETLRANTVTEGAIVRFRPIPIAAAAPAMAASARNLRRFRYSFRGVISDDFMSSDFLISMGTPMSVRAIHRRGMRTYLPFSIR